MKLKRIAALLLCMVLLIGILPMSVFALREVTIGSEGNAAFDYLEYYSGGWKDLNTPRHWVEGSGELAYCMQHKNANPVGVNYRELEIYDLYSDRVIRGLQIIMEYGYPNNTNGMSGDEARQATANAIRFWLSENGDPAQYDWTNRSASPNTIRAKSGYEHVLDWADYLLDKARAQVPMPHSVNFNPNTIDMTISGEYFVGTTKVTLTNCNGGYTLDQSTLPAGSSVTGFTGKNNDNLTIKIPLSQGNKQIRLNAKGYDSRTSANLAWYGPLTGSYQRIMVADTLYGPAGDGLLKLNTPLLGKIQIIKSDAENGSKLKDVVFGIYSDPACKTEVTRITTDANGTGTSKDIPIGKYYIKEIATLYGYVLDGKVTEVNLTTQGETITVELDNVPLKAKVKILKTAEKFDVEKGTFPVSAGKGFKFGLYDEADKLVETLITDETGSAESKELALGKYYLLELDVPNDYIDSQTKYPVDLTAKNSTETVFVGTINVKNIMHKRQIEVIKFDKEYPDVKLQGAVFEILSEDESTVIDTFTTDENGKGKSILLPLGKYVLKEKQAPEGYVLLEEPIPFELTQESETVITFELANVPTELLIEKQDASDKKPMSVKFKLLNSEATPTNLKLHEDGYLYPAEDGDDSFTTDKDGKAVIKYLHIGEYTLVEETPTGYIPAKDFAITITDDPEDNPNKTLILNNPTALKVFKVNSKTKAPVAGAGFAFKLKDGDKFKTLKFTKTEAGYYKVDPNGTVTDVMVNEKGEATILCLPQGEVWIEETVVPKGYFPITAVKVTITNEHTLELPLKLTIENTPSVKLGMDTDKYDVFIAIGACLLGIGLIVWRVIRAKRKKMR